MLVADTLCILSFPFFYTIFVAVNLLVCSLIDVCGDISVPSPFQVTINITRFFGSQGDIIVTGEAKTAFAGNIPANQIAAVATSDFSQSPVSMIIYDGETNGSIIFPLPQNSETTPLKVFNFILTSVERYPVDLSHPSKSPPMHKNTIVYSIYFFGGKMTLQKLFPLLEIPQQHSHLLEGSFQTRMPL